MLAQAAGFAVLAALSPTALLITAVYLGSAQPRTTVLCYLAGAVLVSTVIGIALLLVLRYGNFQLPGYRTPRYELRLGLGLVILAAIAVVARRKPSLLGLAGRPGHPGESLPPGQPDQPDQSGQGKGKGIVSRLVSSPSRLNAVTVGILVFGPGVTFLAAIQVIATARAGITLSAVGLVMVIAINVAFIWLPFLAYLAAPELTTRKLAAFNAWLRAHGRILLMLALLAAGVILVVNGLLGLIRA
jgi:hypothetical protein